MMKELNHIPRVTKQQAEFCAKLGLSVSGDTVGLALAKLHDMVALHFYEEYDLGRPTDKQIDLAAQFHIDISTRTRREGKAIISDLMIELNMASIEEQSLAPGVPVVNKWDEHNRTEIISSIQDDGLVFLKGGNGKRAWARSLKRI
jgi:hypothetical protein